MHTNFIYPVTLVPDEVDGGYIVTCRDLPETITQGNSVSECLEEAQGAVEAAINGRIYSNKEIPKPSKPRKNEHLVAVPLDTAIKAAVYIAMREQGITKSELARRLGVDEKEARRITDPRHGSKLSTMDKALRVLGKQAELVIH